MRALIGVMVFTFAMISAACRMSVADIFHQQRRLWVRLHEKGGKSTRCPATTQKARQMAAHASARTTQLYDRREYRVRRMRC